MTWTYDVTRDVLTVSYGRPERAPARTVGSGDAVLYLDVQGDAIRVEIIRAAQRHHPAVLSDPDNPAQSLWVSLQTAAARFGVKVYALREEILTGGMPARKTEKSWSVSEAVLEIYREILNVRRAADRR